MRRTTFSSIFMSLRDDFEGLRVGIFHRAPLPNIDLVVNELLAEEIIFKSHSHSYLEKEMFTPPPSIFDAPFNKGKP